MKYCTCLMPSGELGIAIQLTPPFTFEPAVGVWVWTETVADA